MIRATLNAVPRSGTSLVGAVKSLRSARAASQVDRDVNLVTMSGRMFRLDLP